MAVAVVCAKLTRTSMKKNIKNLFRHLNSLSAFGVFVLFVLLQSSPSLAGNDQLRIAFINPASKGDSYWDIYVDFMRSASKSLGVKLDVRYADYNRINSPNIAQDILAQEYLPDYLVYIYQHRQTVDILQLAENKKVKSFIVNTGVLAKDNNVVGKPGGKFNYWIGHLQPDNIAAGERLARALVSGAREKNLVAADGKIHMLAVSGSRDSTAALDYNKGLLKVVSENANVELNQLVFSNWNFTTACRQTEGLLSRYPETTIIWSIGEGNAFGTLCGAYKMKRKPGVDLLVGGTVSSAEGVKEIKKGHLIANMGGDTWEGARAVFLLHEHYNGRGFQGQTDIRYLTELVSRENVQPYIDLIVHEEWKDIDYRKLSSTSNKNPIEVEFSVQSLLDTINTKQKHYKK